MEGDFHVLDVDLDYEFDAARFFDFTRPETHSEAEEADLWFEIAPSYPHIRREFHNDMAQDASKVKRKPVGKPFKLRSTTLMNPTASHLAKLNRAREVHSSQSLGRYRKGLNKIDERSSRNHLGSGSDLTKRQKLENGDAHKMLNEQNSKSILRNETAETERLSCEGVHNQRRCETLKNVKARPLTKKLSLNSDEGCSAIPRPKPSLCAKGSKEHMRGSLKQVLQEQRGGGFVRMVLSNSQHIQFPPSLGSAFVKDLAIQRIFFAFSDSRLSLYLPSSLPATTSYDQNILLHFQIAD